MATKSKRKQSGEVSTERNKGGRPSLLTDAVEAKIIKATRKGAFSWVAAVAAGVSPQSYYRWMATGKAEAEQAEDDKTEPTRAARFYTAVTRARAQARLGAEHVVMSTNPLAWLTKGPGRDRPGEPGWTDKIEMTGANGGALTVAVAPPLDLSGLTMKELNDLEALTSKCLPGGSGASGESREGPPKPV